MGVIPINFSTDVETHIKGLRRGNRSQWVNRVVKAAIQARLSDTSSALVEDLSAASLVHAACLRCFTKSNAGTPEEARLIELRNLLIDTMGKMIPKDL